MRGAGVEPDFGMETIRLKRAPFPRRAARADVVTIPVTDAIHRTLRAAARSRGIPFTRWARAVLLRAAAEAHQDNPMAKRERFLLTWKGRPESGPSRIGPTVRSPSFFAIR
jgi:hypothetical protein